MAVAWKRTEVRLESIHLLDPRAESVMLQLLGHLARSVVESLPVGIE